ncbi:SGNH/GDSL hydrolase family protein [Rhodovulum marinum]|uniref:Putative secreted protein n=1 Tax=Rhodovulum marinum TaxID=320662 RepID=A0A4R2Q2F5_9RHOB|nr:SGNH/GDSL hydrolase family protein [Rhodovulum marinum]TCP42853.1 putative secreted protein [Rhodovulum marinum]
MKHLALAVALLAAPLPAAAVSLGTYSDVFVFGDSLSDPGNLFDAVYGAPLSPVAPLYGNAQFSDADAWASQLGIDFASGANFAFGGATAVQSGPFDIALPNGPYPVDVPDFADQRALYRAAAPTLGSNPLAAVWFGGNDLRDAFIAPDPGSAVPIAIGQAVTAIATGVQELVNEGLTTVAVFGLPNLGRVPQITTRGAAAIAAATGATVAFNDTLRTALAGVTGGDLAFVDIFGLFETVAAAPGAYGFTDIEDACLGALLAGTASDCQGFLFYDDLHPTAAGHALIADRFLESIAPVPLPAGGGLLLAGLGMLAIVRRTQAADMSRTA